MNTRSAEVAQGVTGLVLESAHLRVTVLPEKGCDIYALVDKESSIDVLFKTPWGLRRPGPGARPNDSMVHWLEHYPGGWQLLLPNGGAASNEHGVEWGFHGEACLVPWIVDDASESVATLSCHLYRAPLVVERQLSVEGPVFRLQEAVVNVSPDPIEVMWGHHPAFGAPFLEAGCVLSVGAHTVTADDLTPGTMLAPASVHQWPTATTARGEPVDLSAIPAPEDTRAHLAYLSDFDEGFFAMTNPRLGFGVGVRWPLDVFPHAWLWQEIHASEGYPWYRRAYVAAVEPSTTVPAQGIASAREKGGSVLRLDGGERREVVVEAVVYRGGGTVAGIDEGGSVRFAQVSKEG